MIFDLVVSLVVTVASAVYQRVRQKKMKDRMEAELDKQKGFSIPVEGEPKYPVVPYGRNKVGGVRTYHDVSDNFVYNVTSGYIDQREPASGTNYSDTEGSEYKVVVSKGSSGGQIIPGSEGQHTESRFYVTARYYWAGNLLKTNTLYETGGSTYLWTLPNTTPVLDSVFREPPPAATGPDGWNYYAVNKISENDTEVVYDLYRDREPQGGGSQFMNGDMESRSGKKNEYLFVQQVIGYAPINGVKDIEIDGNRYTHKDYKNHHVINVYPRGSVDDLMATDNGVPETNKFTGHAYASMAFKLNRDDYNYNGIPNVSFYLEGLKIPSIVYGADGSYSLSSELVYSNNPAVCLADYLTNTQYGAGLPASSLDLESFYKAAQVCDTTVTTRKRSGVMWFDENEDIKLYECNINLDSESPVRDNIELILETMSNAELIWSDGKYSLRLDYPVNQTEEDNLCVMTLDNSNIVRDNVRLSWPSAADRYNQITVRFRNEQEDFAEDSVTWPKSFSDVHFDYLSEDRGKALKTEIFNPGIVDPYHAQAKAESMVRQSRRSAILEVTLNHEAMLLEPGDFVKVKSDVLGLDDEVNFPSDETFRVESIQFTEDLEIKVTAIQFSHDVLAWNVEDDVSYASKPVYDFSMDPVSSLEFHESRFNETTPANGYLTWVEPEDASSGVYYEVYHSEDGGSTWKSSGTTSSDVFWFYSLESDKTYNFKVYAKRGSTGTRSQPAYVEQFTTQGVSPTTLTANTHQNSVVLRWTADDSPGRTVYNVYENDWNNFNSAVKIQSSLVSNSVVINYNASEVDGSVLYYWVETVGVDGSVSVSSYATGTPTPISESDISNSFGEKLDEAFDRHDEAVEDAEGTVAELRDRVIGALGDIGVPSGGTVDDLPRLSIQKRLEFEETRLTTVAQAASDLEDELVEQSIASFNIGKRMVDAGVYVEPDSGLVKISGIEALGNRQSQVEITLDALESEVQLRASTGYVDQKVSEAILDPSQIPILDDYEARLTSAETTLDGATGDITSVSETLTVDGSFVTMSEVTDRLSSAESALELRVTSSQFDTLEARTSEAEITLDALDVPGIQFTVSDSRRQRDEIELADDARVIDLIESWQRDNATRAADALGRRRITAKVSEDLEAEAQERAELAAVVDNNAALFEQTTTALAEADAAQAGQIETLQAEAADNAAGISDLRATRVTEAEAVAAIDNVVSASFQDLEAMAQATTTVKATVDGIEAAQVLRLNDENVFEFVSVSDGTTGNKVTGEIDTDYVRIKGLTQIDQGVISDLVADDAFIDNLEVDTLQIAGEAVTKDVRAYTKGPIGVLPHTFTTMQSAQLSREPGYATEVFFSMEAFTYQAPRSDDFEIELQLYRGSFLVEGVIKSFRTGGRDSLFTGPIVFPVTDTNTAGGTTTYTVKAALDPHYFAGYQSNIQLRPNNISLRARQFKR